MPVGFPVETGTKDPLDMIQPERLSDWDGSTSAQKSRIGQSDEVFDSLFERSADAIWLYDPETGMLVDCNKAAVELMGAEDKRQFLPARPEDLSPLIQPDGTLSGQKSVSVVEAVTKQKTHRFEWMIRRRDGAEVPVEVSSTAVLIGDKTMHVVISRDISERKTAERELRELTLALERRVTERTAELTASEARLRAMIEHAPEAIVVYSVNTGRFLFGNQHACDLYGVPMSKLAELTPMDVSPEFQSDGRLTSEVAQEKVSEVLSGKTAVFEWIHRRPDGQLIPTEVRLLHLPAEGQNLIRASIIDNTERKRAERALRESEAKFRALFEGASQGVVLHDEERILQVNPAAVRIMGCQGPHELLGKHPGAFSPPFQANGEHSETEARRHIHDCITNGRARFDWLASAPDGAEIPLEVMLTRIEWSGRQIIQAFITDISERLRAQSALAESEALFSAAFQASPILIVIARMSDQKYVLVNNAFVNWSGCVREDILGRDSTEFGIWESQGERDAVWADLRRQGSIHERECWFRNRRGDLTLMLISFEVIQINHAPHVLAMGLDITGRKQAEEASRASEARLRESEARFSAAFHASPAFLGILKLSDGKYVLMNEAYSSWMGCAQSEILGHTCLELGMWDNPADRDSLLNDIHVLGSIRQRECRWRNRRGELFTVLLSAETITLNKTPHMLLMALDITTRKQAEEEMQKALGREKELGQLKSNFVSMVSHEFRTPLGIIQSSGELLRDFSAKMGVDEQAEQLQSIIKNTRRMAGMMEEVLVLSRLDAGKLDFEPTPVDLNLFCRRVVDEVLSATNRRCLIELSLNAIPTEAKADERLLGHVLTNLLTNAVKYSEPGAMVSFSVARKGMDAVCVVRDEGIGISVEDQQQLFNAFHRGANVGTRPGTGLGLLLVKRCAELHGGHVHLHSELDEGTTVTVRFPVFN
jgi:PAS domain S-box-containing protein